MPCSDETVLAWDLPTRLFKWALVLCVISAWATNTYADDRPYLHLWNGYAVLVLLVFRVLWGVFGGTTARFASFVTSPWAAARFLASQLRGHARDYLGHTPIAGQMVMALMVTLFAQACLGLYSSDPDRLIVEGPLAVTVSDAAVHKATSWHRLGFEAICVLASIHIIANLVYGLAGKGYVSAIVTGRKPRAAYVDLGEARPGSLGRAAVCLAAAILIVFGTIMLLGGQPTE